MYLLRVYYSKYMYKVYIFLNIFKIYTKYSYNSTIKRQITLLKNRQRIQTDIPAKKIHKRPILRWKDAQHHLPSGKCKSKP
jgi:hypothetical protein